MAQVCGRIGSIRAAVGVPCLAALPPCAGDLDAHRWKCGRWENEKYEFEAVVVHSVLTGPWGVHTSNLHDRQQRNPTLVIPSRLGEERLHRQSLSLGGQRLSRWRGVDLTGEYWGASSFTLTRGSSITSCSLPTKISHPFTQMNEQINELTHRQTKKDTNK